ASAVESKVLLGEVTTRASEASASVRATFRNIVESEVAALRLGDAGGSDRYVLSESLLRMRLRSDGDGARATCVVSAALRREKGGALLAMIQGEGEAAEAPSDRDATQLRAVRTAVH